MSTSRKTKVFSLSLAQGILTVVGLASSMIFTRVLTKSDYATYLQTFLAYDFIQPILTLGLPLALYNLLPGESRGKKAVIEVMTLLFIIASLLSVFMQFGGTSLLARRFNNPELYHTLRWMIMYPLYTYPLLCLSSILVVNDKVNLNSKYNVFTGLGLTVTVVLSTLMTRDYVAPLLARIIYPLIILPLSVYLCFRYTKGKIEKPEIKSMYKILMFSIPLGLASTLSTLSLQFSNIVVSSLCTPSDYAIYSTGAKELPFISVITGSITVVLMADMASLIKKGQTSDAHKLFKRGAISSSLFLMPIMSFLLFFGEAFIRLLYSDAYIESSLPFRIYLFYLPVRTIQYYSVYIAFGQSKPVLLRTALELVLTVLFCFIFVHLFGYWGAALGAVVTIYVWGLPYNIYKVSELFMCSKRELLPYREFAKISVISLLCGCIAAPCLLLQMPLILVIGIGGVVYMTAYYVLMTKYSKDFKDLTYSLLKTIKK